MANPSGSETSRPARDEYAKKLYEQYGLPETPTLGQIETIAIGLLGSATTLRTGVELIIGRRLQESDPIFSTINLDTLSPQDRFGTILLAEVMKQDAESDLKTRVLLRAYAWISTHRPNLEPYFKNSIFMIKEHEGSHYVLLAMRTNQGYQSLSLKVDLQLDTVELV